MSICVMLMRGSVVDVEFFFVALYIYIYILVV